MIDPIYSIEAEKSILSAMIEESSAIDDAIEDGLDSSDFYSPVHGVIYSSMVDMRNEAYPIDPQTLIQYLSDRGSSFKEITDIIAHGINSISTFKHNLKVVKDKSLLRKIQLICQKYSYSSISRQHEPDSVLEDIEREILSISDKKQKQVTISSKDAVLSCIQTARRAFEHRSNGGALLGLSSGFPSLDHYTMGWRPGELIIVAARPGVGKTVYGLQNARKLARQGHHIGFISMEMTASQLVERSLSAISGIDSTAIRSGTLKEEQLLELERVSKEVADLPMFYEEPSNLTASSFRSRARKLKQKHHIEMLFIDYLQLMSGQTKEKREQEVAEIARTLKTTAMELCIPIMALSQLNRASEMDEEPSLRHIRESGAIEANSDVAIILYRVKQEQDNIVQYPTIFKIAKQRNGACGSIRLILDGPLCKFVEPSRMI